MHKKFIFLSERKKRKFFAKINICFWNVLDLIANSSRFSVNIRNEHMKIGLKNKAVLNINVKNIRIFIWLFKRK